MDASILSAQHHGRAAAQVTDHAVKFPDHSMKAEVSEKGCRSINATNRKSLVYSRLAKTWLCVDKWWNSANIDFSLTTFRSRKP